ncbi:MAG TPA: hypothetical protein VMW52_04870 [Phycisphaerae bacterium]|nr:hypothetical protein [Phycisphaerae bacterium]
MLTTEQEFAVLWIGGAITAVGQAQAEDHRRQYPGATTDNDHFVCLHALSLVAGLYTTAANTASRCGNTARAREYTARAQEASRIAQPFVDAVILDAEMHPGPVPIRQLYDGSWPPPAEEE